MTVPPTNQETRTLEWIAHCEALLASRAGAGLLRKRVAIRHLDSTHIQVEGERFLNFASNDYLGLRDHPAVRKAAADAMLEQVGSGAAGLISGYTTLHRDAERKVASWKATESAVLLPSGYQANVAAVQTLAAIGDSYPRGGRFLVDKLCHASIFDALRTTSAPMRIFPHNGIAKLQRLLRDSDPGQLQIVVTESIFSMDGDAADLRAIVGLKSQLREFVLMVDEAHASGIFGPDGSGLVGALGLGDQVDVNVVTASKALGCSGGAVCASRAFCEALLNFGRAYIYSTAPPPAIAAAIIAAIDVVRAEPTRRERLKRNSRLIRSALIDAGFDVSPGESPIVPIIVGSAPRALSMSRALFDQKIFVPAVRPPTVAPASSRLRLTISSEHDESQLRSAVDVIRGSVGNENGTV